MEACAVYCKYDFGLVVRYLGGEYMAKWSNTESIVGTVNFQGLGIGD